MIVRVVINGLGRMGIRSLLAIQQITEPLRQRGIELSVVGLIDVDQRLREKVSFFTRHLYPVPTLAFQNPETLEGLDGFICQEIGLREDNERYLVYDASPNQFHFANLMSCLKLPRLAYLVEKPMVSHQSELEQLEIMAGSCAARANGIADRLYCDLIETQSAVCLHLQDMVSSGDLEIEELSFYRLNSSGTAKNYSPHERCGVQGGSLMDKSIHDLSITAALLAPNGAVSLSGELRSAMPLCFLPCKTRASIGLLNGYNQIWSADKRAKDWAADGASVFDVAWKDGTRVIPATYSASWVGVTQFEELCRKHGKRFKGIFEMAGEYHGCSDWLHSVRSGYGFVMQEANLLGIRGKLKGVSTRLLVNFLARGSDILPWIWDGGSKRMIAVPPRPFGTNSLARILELGVLAAVGLPVNCIGFDAAMLCHRELLRAHRQMMARDIELGAEIELGREIIGEPIELDWQGSSSAGKLDSSAREDSLSTQPRILGNGKRIVQTSLQGCPAT